MGEAKRRKLLSLPPKNSTKYSHIQGGGWWVSGLNPLADFAEDGWGCFKPRYPRTCWDGVSFKVVKYEYPQGPMQPFFLKVTAEIWERIAQRYGVAIPELLSQTSYGQEFWEWAIANNLPVVITEGVKKAGSLLCAGYVAIGLPGIWNFSDTSDEGIAPYKKPLNLWLLSFFSRFRHLEITLAFDSDSEVSTELQVYDAAQRLANKIFLQVNRKAIIRITQWHPELGKGVDDVIVQHGIEALEAILNSALPLRLPNLQSGFDEWLKRELS